MKSKPLGYRGARALLLSVLCASRASSLLAAGSGAVDPGFDPGNVSFAFGSPMVAKVVVQPDGKILVGGAFSSVQGAPRNGLARLNADGTLDTSFVPPFFVTSVIPLARNMVVQPDGRILVSGEGLNAGGSAYYSIVRLMPDGSVDPTFTLLSMAVSRGVEGLALQPDGRILIGGDFSNIGPASAKTIARLNADGTLDPSFSLEPVTSSYGGRVVSIVLQPDGSVLIGGDFAATAGGLNFTCLARIRADLTLDPGFRPVFNLNEGAIVRSIQPRADGPMYVTGQFSSINGATKISVARLTSAGVVDPSFDVFGTTPGALNDALLQATGKLLITGNFFIPGDRRGIARVDETGAIDGFAPVDGLGPGGIGNTIAVQADGKIVVGGSLFEVGGLSRQGVVRFLDAPPPHTPPNAVDDAVVTAEDTPVVVNVLGNDTDADGDPLAVTAVTSGAHGGVALAGATVIYTPNLDYAGGDTFTYTIDDGHGGTDTATVAVTVTPINDPPAAGDDMYSTPSDTPLAVGAPGILANDADVEGSMLSPVLIAPPASGALNLDGSGAFTYTPAAGFVGTVTFTYVASDGAASSSPATVTIAVTPVLKKVVASFDPIPGGTGVFGTFPGAPSMSGRFVSFVGLGSSGQQGAYSCDRGQAGDPCVALANLDTPIPGGTGSFTGFGSVSAAGTLSAFVGAGAGQSGVYACDRAIPTDPCTPVADRGSAIPGAAGTFSSFGGISIAKPTPPTVAPAVVAFVGGGAGRQGVYSCAQGEACTPVADRTTSIPDGTGTFTGFGDVSVVVSSTPNASTPVVAFVGSGAAQQGVYSCAVAIATDPCTTVVDLQTAIPGGSGTFTAFDHLAAARPEMPPPGAGASVVFVGSGAGQQGVYSCGPGDPCVPVADLDTPIPGGRGTFAGFTAVSASRGHTAFLGLGPSGQVGLYVASTLTKVAAVGDTLAGKEIAGLRLGPAALDGNRLAFTAVFGDGTESIFVAELGLVPDGAPAATDDMATTLEDAAVTIDVLANDSDADGDAPALGGVTQPAHGSAVKNANGTVTYTPRGNFNGIDSFTYTVSDGRNGTSSATVTVVVIPVNDPPTAAADSYTAAEDATLAVAAPGVLANDQDVDGDSLVAVLVTNASHGQITLGPNGSFTYVPTAGYNGPDAFTYRVSDGVATSSPATVTLAVTPGAPGAWRATGGLRIGRAGHTATLLHDGRVLVAGGSGAAALTAELYDPVVGTWSRTGDLRRPRLGHTATLLADGRVLVAGSVVPSPGGVIARSSEIYDPATGSWTLAASLRHGHAGHTATLLRDGRVLVAGGSEVAASRALASSTELFDPAAGTWALAADLPQGRVGHQATLLADGRVLVSGGTTVRPRIAALRRTDVFDPANGSWTRAGDMNTPRSGHSATLLPDGRVLVAGGIGNAAAASTAERFDPATSGWSRTANPRPRSFQTASLLPNGVVLIAGGIDARGAVTRTTARFDPAAGAWADAASLRTPRVGHTMTVLADGRVLVAGGTSGAAALRGAELFGP